MDREWHTLYFNQTWVCGSGGGYQLSVSGIGSIDALFDWDAGPDNYMTRRCSVQMNGVLIRGPLS